MDHASRTIKKQKRWDTSHAVTRGKLAANRTPGTQAQHLCFSFQIPF
jgi:hypothetical protein